MKTIISICIALFFTFVCACERVEENYLSENVEYAAAQYKNWKKMVNLGHLVR